MLLQGSGQLQQQQSGSAGTIAAPEVPGSSAIDNTCMLFITCLFQPGELPQEYMSLVKQ
jgi:hypothetical protein